MAITRVNKLGTATGGAGISSLTLTVGATTTAHNRVIVALFWGASNRTVAVTDLAGNNYTQDIATLGAPGAGGWGTVLSARADSVLSSGSGTITATWTGGTVSDAILAAYEYSGLANFSPVDVAISDSGTTHTSSSGNAVTTQANALIFGLTGWAANSTATLPTYTELDQVHGSAHSLETQEDIVAATGTYAVGLTMTGTPNWAAFAVAYSDIANVTVGQPASATAPVITGSGVIGMQLTCSQGAWTNNPTSYSYQWKRDGSNLAVGAHYLVTAADVGHVLSCAVSAANKYGSVAATASNTVTPTAKQVAPGLGI